MVTPAAKREAVVHLRSAFEVSERRACSVLEADRTSIRYRSTRPDDAAMRTRLRELASQRRRFGYRRLHIRREVEAPTLIEALRQCDRRPGAESPLAARAPTHLKALLTVETAKLLVIHDQPLAGEKDVQAPVAEPTPLRSQLTQSCSHGCIIWPRTTIADRGPVRLQNRTRPPFAHLERGTQV